MHEPTFIHPLRFRFEKEKSTYIIGPGHAWIFLRPRADVPSGRRCYHPTGAQPLCCCNSSFTTITPKSVWLVVDDNFIHFHFMVISESSSRRFSQVDTRWLHVFGTNELVRESLKTKNIVDLFEIQLGEQKDICTIIKLVDTDEKTFCSYVRSEH